MHYTLALPCVRNPAFLCASCPQTDTVQALLRDCYRCQATGSVDFDTAAFTPGLRERVDARVDVTDVRHIIPDFDYDPSHWKDSPLVSRTLH